MIFTDSHTHLYDEQFDLDRNEMVQRALDEGISRMFLPNIDSGTIKIMLDLCKAFPSNCFPMMGLHPTSVKENYLDELTIVKQQLDSGQFCAVGEIGIDLYWDKTFQKQQEDAFRQQIRWAKETQLPIVIHARDSFEEIFAIVDEENDESLSGIFHCFTGSVEQGRHILDYGNFKLGIGGVVTFKNGGLAETLEHIDIEHLVLETDSPYLTPTPHRGKRNESSYLMLIAKKLSEIYDVPLSTVASVTTSNSKEIFGL